MGDHEIRKFGDRDFCQTAAMFRTMRSAELHACHDSAGLPKERAGAFLSSIQRTQMQRDLLAEAAPERHLAPVLRRP